MFKKKFNPDLIDLEKYRYTLLDCLDIDVTLRPTACIPDRFGGFTCEEMQAMKQNRRLAQDIYEEMKSRIPE